MRTIEEMRELIPGHEQYTDEQIQEIEATLEGLADLTFDTWLEERNNIKKLD